MNKTPKSIQDAKDHFFVKTWKWVNRKPRWLKVMLSLVILVLFVTAARLHLLGTQFYRYTKVIIPITIPIVDPQTPIIPLSFKYEIENNFGRRPGKLGDTCFDGDRLYVSFRAGVQCWVSVFGIDSKQKFEVFRDKFEPSLIEQDETYTLDLVLDGTHGMEVYYAIVASEPFDFEKEINPRLGDIFSKGGSKGISPSEYELKLPDIFTHKYFYFNHISQ